MLVIFFCLFCLFCLLGSRIWWLGARARAWAQLPNHQMGLGSAPQPSDFGAQNLYVSMPVHLYMCTFLYDSKIITAICQKSEAVYIYIHIYMLYVYVYMYMYLYIYILIHLYIYIVWLLSNRVCDEPYNKASDEVYPYIYIYIHTTIHIHTHLNVIK